MTPERKKKIEDVLNQRQSSLVVVLENVWDPHNISAVMRSCDATGVQDIIVLNTSIPSHKNYGEKSSASARKWVTVHDYTDIATCVQDLRQAGYSILTSHLGVESMSLYETDMTEKVALVFGNEKDGISDELLAYSDGNFIIPQVGMVQSLNISVACAITLYEAYRQRSARGMYDVRSLPDAQFTELQKKWEENKPLPRFTSDK